MAFPYLTRKSAAVLLVRTDPSDSFCLSAEDQERILKDYCASLGVQVYQTIKLSCPETETIGQLDTILPSLPDRITAVIAVRIHRYTTFLEELTQFCFKCKHLYNVELYSMEFGKPIRTLMVNLRNPYNPNITWIDDEEENTEIP